jgi:uncharacterized membrane protein
VTRDTPSGAPPGGGILFVAIGVFVLVGAPIVYVVWEAVNQALTGNLDAVRLEVVFPATAGLVVLIYMLMRVLRRWSDRA